MSQKLVVIGASTGGVEALETVFSQFPADIPPVLVVQHMPIGFTDILAKRFNLQFKFNVKEAREGDEIKAGQILIAPAGKHMQISKKNGRDLVETFVGPKVQYSMPSVDVLFESVAKHIKDKAVGVILTGMGADGADGLLAMKNAGAATIGQDEKTCAIYGMPKVAMDMGAVMYQLPLNKIADKILTLAKGASK
ncbi:MAG: CheB methylesterase domain-containing protein [Defluviitaleaceae bacterium]|nr:CheB methylesterase domain-containing protein [Defluviitaleaceae bacterium]